MTASAQRPLVCVVDDDVSVEGRFREEGFHVNMFESAEGFLAAAPTGPDRCGPGPAGDVGVLRSLWSRCGRPMSAPVYRRIR